MPTTLVRADVVTQFPSDGPSTVRRLKSRSWFDVRPDERANVFTHLIGAFLSMLGTFVLAADASAQGAVTKIPSLLVCGLTLTLSYAASVLYHASDGTARPTFLMYDRMAIYIAIAGFYTPIALHGMADERGVPLLLSLWVLAATGAACERHGKRDRSRTSVALYGVMAWSCLVVAHPLTAGLTSVGFQWLVAGLATYSLGAVTLYLPSVPRQHEIWHVLAVVGSACHYVMLRFFLP